MLLGLALLQGPRAVCFLNFKQPLYPIIRGEASNFGWVGDSHFQSDEGGYLDRMEGGGGGGLPVVRNWAMAGRNNVSCAFVKAFRFPFEASLSTRGPPLSPYRGTWLIRKRTHVGLLGPYRRAMPGVLLWS